MLRQASRLVPFEGGLPPGLKVSAEMIWSRDGWLELSYGVLATASSGLADLVIPGGLIDGRQTKGERRDGLWTTTCFEAFVALPGCTNYWEINLSASGDWALYRFDDYRQGQHPQALVKAPLTRLRRRHHQLRLDARFPLAPWWPDEICPDLALSCVLDRGEAGLSHWALSHPEHRADFHDRSTFLQA